MLAGMVPSDRRSQGPSAAALIFLVAVIVRVGLAVAAKAYTAPAYGEAVMVARSIARGGGFANPYATPTGATAHVAPAYTYLLAAILHWIPWGPQFRLVTLALGILGSSVAWALLPWCAQVLALERRTGILAGLYGAIDPLRRGVELDGAWEASFAAVALIGAIALTFRWRQRFYQPRVALGVGCAWGLALLLQPAFLMTFVAVLAVLVVETGRAAIASVAWALAAMLVVIAPWLVRNDVALGGPIFLRSNFGLELDLSNNDRAAPDIGDNLHRNLGSTHPDVNLDEARKMAAEGERIYYGERMRRALAWITGHRARFGQLTAWRFADYWVPMRRNLWLRGMEAIATLAAFAGLWLMFRDRRPATPYVAAIWIAEPLVYYLVQADERYRYPMEWTVALCAAYFVLRVTGRSTTVKVAAGKLLRDPQDDPRNGPRHSGKMRTRGLAAPILYR